MTNSGDVGAHLASRLQTNSSLRHDAAANALFDASVASNPTIRTVLVGGVGSVAEPWGAAHLAKFVGAGMLAGLIVSGDDDEEVEGVSPLRRLSEALGVPGDVKAEESEGAAKEVCLIQDRAATTSPGFSIVVDDVITGGECREASASSGSGIILVTKICGALASMGYDVETVAKVGGLVLKNTMTILQSAAPINSNDGHEDEVDDEQIVRPGLASDVHSMLEAMVDRSVSRSRTVHVNSNEPVLLINDASKHSDTEHEFGQVITETIQQLQQEWNIWPVRIYAGQFLDSDNHGFSITLLNVCNTDIGGPSMIQLLDHPCEASGWHDFVRRETWDNRTLLKREDKELHSIMRDSGIGLRDPDVLVTEQEENYLAEESPEAPLEPVALNVIESDSAAAASGLSLTSDDVASDNLPVYESSSKEPVRTLSSTESDIEIVEDEEEREQVDDFEEIEPSRPPIQHPTWQHGTESESLLDLVRRQSSRVAATNEKEDANEVAAGLGSESAEPAEGTKPASDEGFELV